MTAPHSDDDHCVFTPTAAAIAGVGKDHISRLCRQGVLAATRYEGMWLVSVASLCAFFSGARDRLDNLSGSPDDRVARG